MVWGRLGLCCSRDAFAQEGVIVGANKLLKRRSLDVGITNINRP